jgi:hypothetical protein
LKQEKATEAKAKDKPEAKKTDAKKVKEEPGKQCRR